MQEVEFFHVARNVGTAVSFKHDGAMPIGKGVGGQSDGFYCSTNLQSAKGIIRFISKGVQIIDDDGIYELIEPFSPKGGLLVSVRVPLEDIKYPVWQIDTETNSVLENLIAAHSDVAIGVGEFSFMNVPGKKETIRLLRQSGTNKFYFEAKYQNYLVTLDLKEPDLGNNNSNGSGFIQALIDAMCQQSQKFLQEYNRLLRRCAINHKEHTAIKYTGKKSLPVSGLIWIKPDKEGNFTQKQLYPRRGQMSEKDKRREASLNIEALRKMKQRQ